MGSALSNFPTTVVMCVLCLFLWIKSFIEHWFQVISVGEDQWHTIAVWDWKEKAAVPKKHAGGDSNKIFCLASNPHDSKFVSAGKNHIRFWNIVLDASGNVLALNSKNGVFGKAGPQTILSVVYVSSEVVAAGTSTGNVMLWQGNSCLKVRREKLFFLVGVSFGV